MLRSRPVLEVLRQTPLRAAHFRTSPPVSQPISTGFRTLLNRHINARSLSFARTAYRAGSTPLSRCWPSFARRARSLRWNSSKPTVSTNAQNGNGAPQSLSQRFKDLSRRYGYAAVGVYLGLSVLDFPFCFLTVRLVGPARIGEVEHAIVDAFWSIVAVAIPSMGPEDRETSPDAADGDAKETQSTNGKNRQNENASIWTQLLLAYGVHKSLIFFRIPLTAAVTPKVVKTLRSWGWNIGRPAKQVKSSAP